MSITKYLQFYKDNGFFSGSIIRATVKESSFYGHELLLSKDGVALQNKTIGEGGIVDFFTDESGKLTLSADNGSSVLSGDVDVAAYGTYNVTLNNEVANSDREAYAKDITMDASSVTANIAYTGDKSTLTAVASDPSLISLSVDNNKITMTDAGNDKVGKCSITATIEATDKYDSAEVTFNVNKVIGSYGSWETASDEKIAEMIGRADAGEIDLADFWNVGDTRRVRLNAIAAGTETSAQPEQDIDLVILHNPVDNDYYRLTTPTAGHRYQPNFIIGTKECLENPTAMGYFQQSVTVSYPNMDSYISTGYSAISNTKVSELLTMLNNGFIAALPEYIQKIIKYTNRRYSSRGLTINSSTGYGYLSMTSLATLSHRVSLPNIVELGKSSTVSSNGASRINSTTGTYQNSGEVYNGSGTVVNAINNVINSAGTKFSYYNDNGIAKKKGSNGNNIYYLVNDTLLCAYAYRYNSGYQPKLSYALAYYIDADGNLQTNNLDSEAQRTALRGISPIMFI